MTLFCDCGFNCIVVIVTSIGIKHRQTMVCIHIHNCLDLFPHVPQDDIGSQQLYQFLRELNRKTYVLFIEKLFVNIQQNLVLIHVWAEAVYVFFVKLVNLLYHFFVYQSLTIILSLLSFTLLLYGTRSKDLQSR